MTNLQKIVIFIVTIGILFYTTTKIGIINLLVLSAIFSAVAFVLFCVWLLRPTPTHRNNFKTFNLTFESKRIEFEALPNGLYRINLCTKHFAEIDVRKETFEHLHSTDGAKTFAWRKMPIKLQRQFFTKDITVQLSEKLLTEKQALKLHFELLKKSKVQSVVSAIYISNLIESIGKPKFLTAKRLAFFKDARLTVQAQIKAKMRTFAPLPPSHGAGAGTPLVQNSLLYVFLFAFNSPEMQATNFIIENELEAYLYSFAILLFIIKCITNFRYYLENECVG